MDDWVCFQANDSSFVQCLRTGITPHSYRKYDNETGVWMVWYEKIFDLVLLAKNFYSIVDKSRLPSTWQQLAAGANLNKSISNSSYHSILFLTENAPIEVIKASYKALVSKYHPDHNDGNGDPKKLNQVIEAYKKIVGK